jgi:hypothetical protein
MGSILEGEQLGDSRRHKKHEKLSLVKFRQLVIKKV